MTLTTQGAPFVGRVVSSAEADSEVWVGTLPRAYARGYFLEATLPPVLLLFHNVNEVRHGAAGGELRGLIGIGNRQYRYGDDLRWAVDDASD